MGGKKKKIVLSDKIICICRRIIYAGLRSKVGSERSECTLGIVAAALVVAEHRERHCVAGQKQSSGLFLVSLRATALRRHSGAMEAGAKHQT